MENRNFLVLDGGLGSALIRAGFDIDVSNYDTFFYFINAHKFIFSTTPGNTFIMHAAISHYFPQISLYEKSRNMHAFSMYGNETKSYQSMSGTCLRWGCSLERHLSPPPPPTVCKSIKNS